MRKASSVSFLRKKWMWLCKVAPSALRFLAVVFVVLGVTLHVRLHGNDVQERHGGSGSSIPALFSEQITDLTANSEFEFDGVVDSRHHVETTYNDITKIEDVYGFLKGPFLESFWPNAYDPGNASHVMEGQIDKGNMLVGAVRFRQQRDMLRVCHVQTGALLAPLRRHHQCIATLTNKGNFTTIDPGVTATAAADGNRRRRRTTSNAATTNGSATAVSTTKEGASEGASEVTVHQYIEDAVADGSLYPAQRGSRYFGPGGYVLDVPPADETGALAAFEKMEVSERER